MKEFPNSALETVMFEELFADCSLPMPELQYEIRDSRGSVVGRPDFVYPDEKLVIEGHSRLWHEGKAAEVYDLERHRALVALGYRILYISWVDVTQYAEHTRMMIRAALTEQRVLCQSERAHAWRS